MLWKTSGLMWTSTSVVPEGIVLRVGWDAHIIGEYLRKEYSFKEYAYLEQVKWLLQWSGFIGGWLVFLYYWVFKLWDTDIAALPAVTIGLLIYVIAFLVYELLWRARKSEYDAVIDLVDEPYWDLVMSVMKGEREKAQKAIEELSAYVPDPGE